MSYIFDISLGFILIFISCCFVFGWGHIINKKFNIKVNCASENIIVGLFFIGSFALILNFVTNINNIVNLIVFSLGILFLLGQKRNFINNFKIILIISLIATITIAYSRIYLPDAAHYHLPYISILNESKIIIGINNINLRYGQISILQYISSVFNFNFFDTKTISIPPVLIFSSLLYFFLSQFIKNKNQLLKILSFLICSIFLIDMNRYSEFGNDEPGHMIFFYLNYLVIKNLFSSDLKENYLSDYKKVLYLALFLFMIKITYALVFFTLLFYFFFHKQKLQILDKFNFILFVIFILWLLKNFLTTSCFIYPIELTCVSSIWNNYGYLSENILTEAWSKGYPDQSEIKNLSQYNDNFFIWFSIWSKNHLLLILEKLTLVILFFGFSYFLINFSKKNYNKINKSFYFFIILNFTYTMIWFYFFPVYRFGSGYIIFLFLLIYLLMINKRKIISSTKLSFLIILLFIFVTGKNFNRILTHFNNDQYKTKKKFALPLIKVDNKKITHHSSRIFFSTHPFYCYYSKGLCTSWDIKDLGNIEIIKKYKYFIILNQNKKNWWKKKFGIK